MTPEQLRHAKRLSKLQRVLIKKWHHVTRELHQVLDVDPEYLEMKRTGVMPQWLVDNLPDFPGYGAYYRRPGEPAPEPYIIPRTTINGEPISKPAPKQSLGLGMVEAMLKNMGAPATKKNSDPFAS